jgi:hypothetical protein
MRNEFSPTTLLNIRNSLVETGYSEFGSRSKLSSFELTWTVLNLQRIPPAMRCCYICNPELATLFVAASKHDERLHKFSADFLYPLASRPGSSTSMRSDTSNTSNVSRKAANKVAVSVEEKERLNAKLVAWRREKHEQRGSPSFFSPQILLPPKQLQAFVDHCPKFLHEATITPHFLRKLIPWDFPSESNLEEIIKILHDWRETASLGPPATPKSQRRARKRARSSHPDVDNPTTPRAPPPAQPIFLHQRTSTSSKYIGSDENVFVTRQAPVAPLPQVIYATPLPTRSCGATLSHYPTIPAGPAASSPAALTPINANPYYHMAPPVHYQPYPYFYTPSPTQTRPMQYTFKSYNPYNPQSRR